mmetsp:Transcript_17137/g.43700  ORF Transcript_17137/g.43700 Transcript_17137/m.43700 type:complete len:225 (-) Transcript_17137:2-676(-)
MSWSVTNQDFAHGDELMALDFEHLIGGPLSAVIKAQAEASLTTTSFVKEVGFKKQDKKKKNGLTEPIYVTFELDKPGLFGMPRKSKLKVPLLTMVPIPSLRVEYVEISFLAKITSTKTMDVTNNNMATNMNTGDMNVNSKGWTSTATHTAMNVNQYQSKEGATVTRDFSLKINVKAVQDELPAGLDRLLKIMEKQIQEVPQGTDAVMKMMGGGGAGGGGGRAGG